MNDLCVDFFYASAGIFRHRVCLSVCHKPAKRRITQATLRDSPGTLVNDRRQTWIESGVILHTVMDDTDFLPHPVF